MFTFLIQNSKPLANSLVCVGPGRTPERWFSHDAAQMSCYVDGVISDKIDQSISANQSEQLVIICALCGSVYKKQDKM